ncbi:hypothetical protein [Bacillus thuringiensis]|uniref:hypothetical protein n=1 Tax=Bacillus thuringiensis TaxID=1428 RepID=UPI002FBEDAA9
MNIKEKLETEEIQQAIYKYAVETAKKDQKEFPPERMVLNKTNTKYTEFEVKSTDLSKWGQGNLIIQVQHKSGNVELFKQDIDGENWSKRTKDKMGEQPLAEIIKKYGLNKENYKEAFKNESLEQINKEVEQDVYKDLYKGQVLNSLEQQKESTKEKVQYKERFKNGILKLLNAEPKQPMKHVEKEDVKANHDKNMKKMREFEKSHSFVTIYQLRKEAFNELKELDLTEPQKEKLLKLEENLDKQKQEYDKNINKTNSSKETNEKKNEKQKKKSVEMER